MPQLYPKDSNVGNVFLLEASRVDEHGFDDVLVV